MVARSTGERITLIDVKISEEREKIKALEAWKQKLLHPVIIRTVMEKAEAAGLSTEKIAEKLGPEMQLHILWKWTARMRRPFLYT